MDQLVPTEKYSPYRFFSAEDWARFRADTPLTLTADEVRRLSSLYDPIDLDEVRRIYLSLSRLLSAHVEASQTLFRQRKEFLNVNDAVKTPFIIGMAGSVAVGKSTTARVLKELLARWPSSPKVDLVTTDGFLHLNEVLRRDHMMERKGFPESYDVGALLRFLSGIKSGQPNVRAPVYSHLTYDVIPGEFVTIDRPDILIFEGLNVLQTRELPHDGKAVPFVSDFFDFSIYIMVHRALHEAQGDSVPQPRLILPPVLAIVRGRGNGDCGRPVAQHQPEKSQGKYCAYPAARRSHPEERPQSSGRGSCAKEALILPHFCEAWWFHPVARCTSVLGSIVSPRPFGHAAFASHVTA
jgi:type I pantothenate kinase